VNTNTALFSFPPCLVYEYMYVYRIFLSVFSYDVTCTIFGCRIQISITYKIVPFTHAVPPSMKPFSFEGESNVGETAQLTCHVIKGDTPLEIIWAFRSPDGRVQPMPQPIIENRIGKKIMMLEIPTVTEYHRGSYSCIAKNRAGGVDQTALLMVNGILERFR